MNHFNSFKPTWTKSVCTIVVLIAAYIIALMPCNQSRCVPGGVICTSQYCHAPEIWAAWLVWPIAFYLLWSLIASRKR